MCLSLFWIVFSIFRLTCIRDCLHRYRSLFKYVQSDYIGPYGNVHYRLRDFKVRIRDEKRSQEDHVEQVSRVTEAVSGASTRDQVQNVLNNDDVVNIICGPAEIEIRRLKRELRQEKKNHQSTQRFVFTYIIDCVTTVWITFTYCLQTSQSQRQWVCDATTEDQRVGEQNHTHRESTQD